MVQVYVWVFQNAPCNLENEFVGTFLKDSVMVRGIEQGAPVRHVKTICFIFGLEIVLVVEKFYMYFLPYIVVG